jgi:hypothetical protein
LLSLSCKPPMFVCFCKVCVSRWCNHCLGCCLAHY